MKIIKTLDEAYPEEWSIEVFKKIKSFNKRIEYCNKYLQKISAGSARIVYKVDDEKVLKLAKNNKGLAQNEVEIDFSDEPNVDSSLLAKIFDCDKEHFLFTEMELAKKVTESIFKNVVKLVFQLYRNLLLYIGKSNESYHIKEEHFENEFFKSVYDYITWFEIPVGDLRRLSTYGLVKRDGENLIVIIDYGLTSQVYDSYYK